MCIPAHVPLGLDRLAVYTAIQFHDQASPRAVKIDDVLTERMLSAESEGLKFNSPQ
jgi:hypothetical protein